jgi:hypothetical protein
MVKLVGQVHKIQEQFQDDPGNGPQRKLLARLKQWERTFGTAITVLDNLPPLPSDLEKE